MEEKKPKPSMRDWLQAETERIDREQPILETRYYVVEVTPRRRESDEYDNYWTKRVVNRVSGYADSEEGLDPFFEKFKPSEGNHFEVHSQNLRAIPRWVSY